MSEEVRNTYLLMLRRLQVVEEIAAWLKDNDPAIDPLLEGQVRSLLAKAEERVQ